MSDLKGKTAIVTGAAQGIGLAILNAFKHQGAQAKGIDIQSGKSDIRLDISDYHAVQSFVANLDQTPEILVNAAGICPTRPFQDITPESFETTLKINVVGAFALMSALAKRWMDEGKQGVIINIASNSGFLPKLEQLDYGASKAALISLTRSAALSLGPHGIRVNAIAPGVIDTPLTQSIASQRAAIRGTTPEATLQPILDSLPLRRMGQPEEVAQLAVFLASDKASFITGQTYLVDGGQLMR